MRDLLYLTWRHMMFNRARIALLVVLIALVAALPMALNVLPGEPPVGLSAQSSVPGAAPATGGDPREYNSVLNTLFAVVGVVSVTVIVLALALGLGPRRDERGILVRIGCSPGRIKALLALEVFFISLASGVLVAIVFLIARGIWGQSVRLPPLW